MEMTACTVCGKIFGASSGKVCPACGKLLDMVYEKARAYLRDHPHADMHARDLAKAIKEDEKLVEMLMIQGRFDRREDSGSDEDKKKMKLLEELQKNLSVPSQKESAASTYGSDRHGAGKDR